MRIKKIIYNTPYKIISITDDGAIIKSNYDNINSIEIKIIYNFIGIKNIRLIFYPDKKLTYITKTVNLELFMHEFNTKDDFVKKIQSLELKANQIIKKMVYEYSLKKDQLLLF